MKDFAPTILGLDVGARQIGASVFRGEQLIFYAVKTIKCKSEAGTLKRMREVLIALIERYGIEVVAFEKVVYPQQYHSFVKTVYREAKEVALNKHLGIFEYRPNFTRRIICLNEKATKRNAASHLARKYTELARYFNVPKLWQKRYYAQLFDAIAAGLVCAKEFGEARMPAAIDSTGGESYE